MRVTSTAMDSSDLSLSVRRFCFNYKLRNASKTKRQTAGRYRNTVPWEKSVSSVTLRGHVTKQTHTRFTYTIATRTIHRRLYTIPENTQYPHSTAVSGASILSAFHILLIKRAVPQTRPRRHTNPQKEKQKTSKQRGRPTKKGGNEFAHKRASDICANL